MSGRAAAIDVESVSVLFGDLVALRDLSFSVAEGEIVCLLGPNGAGKTTTVNVCCALLEPDSGGARVLGRPASLRSREFRLSIGMLPQETALYPELTAKENLRLIGAMYGVSDLGGRVAELLEVLGLTGRDRERVSGFSGGMRRRLALARALLHDPPVLFLDEPTLGVDPHGRRALWDHIATLSAAGRAVLLTTNYLDEATALADRVIIIENGEIVAQGSPRELRRRGGVILELRCKSDTESVRFALESHPGVTSVSANGDVVSARIESEELGPVLLIKAQAADEILSFRTDEPTLEDVFLSLTGARPAQK